MNNIYRVTWNKSTQTFQAVCEFTKTQGRSASNKVGRTSLLKNNIFIFAVIPLALMQINTTYANVYLGSYKNNNTNDLGTVNNGTDADAVYIGKGANSDSGSQRVVAIGKNASTKRNDSTAIGSSAQADSESVSIGSGAKSTEGGVTIGHNNNNTVQGSQAVAIGQDARGTGYQSIAVGGNTRAKGAGSIAIGGDDLNPFAGGG